ncbi:MAG: 16S rRNA (adenine(1518)-N(6)/adenine(1519)-N(6))-dimethyltransferase RsmA [Pseudomonadota bacterium]|nr:16S rRNA (adenine(1518)-N(6)/adenine(1519)-N(6))-dimethyltransferase RsmA [Pseudomonadota bacterium]
MIDRYRAKKRLGQNFLIDNHVIQNIINSIHPKSSDIFIEIGPGKGAITLPIAQSGAELHAVELDRDLIPQLKSKFNLFPKITIHHDDALRFHYSDIGKELRIIGNLPYNISTPLLFHLMEHKENILDQHLMLQKEVANRLSAKPGEKSFGRLTVMFGTYMDTLQLFDVPNTSFQPAPKILSSVVKIKSKPKNEIIIKNSENLSKIVKQAFSQRRKTLRNSLKGLISAKMLEELNIDPSKRAEEIPIISWSKLSNKIQIQ